MRAAAILREDRRLRDEAARLTITFWQAVAERRMPRGRHMVQGSPLRILFDLLGVHGPRLVTGIPVVQPLMTAECGGVPGRLGGGVATTGEVQTPSGGHPFTIHWRRHGGRLAAVELLPFDDALTAKLPPFSALPRRTVSRLYSDAAPLLAGCCDPLVGALRDVDLPVVGLPVILRCLAAGRRAGAVAGAHPPVAVAAALVGLVAPRSGVTRGLRVAAAAHHVEAAVVERWHESCDRCCASGRRPGGEQRSCERQRHRCDADEDRAEPAARRRHRLTPPAQRAGIVGSRRWAVAISAAPAACCPCCSSQPPRRRWTWASPGRSLSSVR